MTTTHRIARIRRDLEFVAGHWLDLHEARIPGTRRRWSQTRTRAESRLAATTGVQLPAGIAKAPAPANLDVLDILVDVLATAHALADAVAQLAGIERLPAPNSAYADPRPYLDHASKHLEAASEIDGGWILDAALDPEDDLSINRARRRTAAGLQLVLSGQILDADCPWCYARPLRIRIVHDEPLVVCESRRVCTPPESDCGTWIKGRPAWIQPEWEWLAQRISHAEDMAYA